MGNGVQMLAFSMAWWKFCLTWFDVTAGAQGFQGFLSATASDWIPISQINPTFIQSPDQLKFSWNLSPHGFPLNRWQIPGSFEGWGEVWLWTQLPDRNGFMQSVDSAVIIRRRHLHKNHWNSHLSVLDQGRMFSTRICCREMWMLYILQPPHPKTSTFHKKQPYQRYL